MVAKRTDKEPIVKLPITGDGSNFISALDNLVQTRQTFHRVLFETHGSPGAIYFGKASIPSSWVWAYMTTRNYDLITPNKTRIYFNGCNVAEGNAGWDFLRAMAKVFLLRGGGEVFGHTSLGFATKWGIYPKVFHLWGDLRKVHVAPGGKIIKEESD